MLEFRVFRLLLAFLMGLFEVYGLFGERDEESNDRVLGLADFQAVWPRLQALGVPPETADQVAFWRQLKGENEVVGFSEFAAWAALAGLASPELLEAEREAERRADEAADLELCQRLKEASTTHWTR